MFDLIINSLAVAVIVTTITKGAILKSARNQLTNQFLKKLFNCPYCLAHWISIPFAFTMEPFNFINIFALIAISSLPTFLLIKYIRWLDVN